MIDNGQTEYESPLIAPKSVGQLPRGIVYDGGFKFMGTPLGFSGAKNVGLMFVAHPGQKIPAGTRRLLVHRSLAPLYKSRRNTDILSVDYHRPFRVGRMDLTLLPSGGGVGTAMLEIRLSSIRILYVTRLRSAKPISGEPLPSLDADLLLLDNNFSFTKQPAPQTEKRRLLKWLSAHPHAQLVCADAQTAADVYCCLAGTSAHLGVQSSLYKYLRDTGLLGQSDVQALRLSSTHPQTRFDLTLTTAVRSADASTIDVAYVGDRSVGDAAERFFLGQNEDAAGVLKFARDTGAARIAISSNADAQFAQLFKKQSQWRVHYSQKPLQLLLPF